MQDNIAISYTDSLIITNQVFDNYFNVYIIKLLEFSNSTVSGSSYANFDSDLQQHTNNIYFNNALRFTWMVLVQLKIVYLIKTQLSVIIYQTSSQSPLLLNKNTFYNMGDQISMGAKVK